jgi:hypothetical protein
VNIMHENIYYKAIKLRGTTVKEALRPIFGEGTDYTLNWLFLSTSGVHGTYTTLDKNLAWDERQNVIPHPWPREVTCLVVHPRTCTLRWGELQYDEDDETWLREVVGKTLAGVAESQAGNLPSDSIQPIR